MVVLQFDRNIKAEMNGYNLEHDSVINFLVRKLFDFDSYFTETYFQCSS